MFVPPPILLSLRSLTSPLFILLTRLLVFFFLPTHCCGIGIQPIGNNSINIIKIGFVPNVLANYFNEKQKLKHSGENLLKWCAINFLGFNLCELKLAILQRCKRPHAQIKLLLGDCFIWLPWKFGIRYVYECSINI